MRPEVRLHGVTRDHPALLEALAAPFGTYVGVAVCRAVPAAASLAGLAVDLLVAVGKTEALIRRRGPGVELVEAWFGAYALRTLYVTGADSLPPVACDDLCRLGDRVGFDVVFVTADPARRVAGVGCHLREHATTYLHVDPRSTPVQPPVGAPLPDVGFPALPAACAELLEGAHAERARAIYAECLDAAFHALANDRLVEAADVEAALRAALARTPDLSAVALAAHALRAAGLLRGYDVRARESEGEGVAFDDLLTADRLDQLCRLVAPAQAAAGVLAGLSGAATGATIGPEGRCVDQGGVWQGISGRPQPLLGAWARIRGDPTARPSGAPSRPIDPRREQLWRRPPPARLALECRIIDCRSLRLIADPPMSWTRPPRRRRNGSVPSAQRV